MNTKKMTTWEQVMAMKKNDTRHQGVANNLTKDELTTVIAVVDFFGGSVKQAYFDLEIVRYRVFDWLGMLVMGGDNNRVLSAQATKVLAYSFLKVDGDINRWIDDLRVTDYDVDDSWVGLDLS